MSIKLYLGAIATTVAILGYIPYVMEILRGRTKPHAFSWLVWGFLTGIAFVGQISEGAGAGAWATGVTTFVCGFIFIAALTKGEKNITRGDWLSLFGAAISLLFWFVTEGPLLSIVLVTIIDAFGFLPTFRKSFHRPHEETLITYVLSALKWMLVIFALENYTVVTWLYPVSLVMLNAAFVLMLTIRRKSFH